MLEWFCEVWPVALMRVMLTVLSSLFVGVCGFLAYKWFKKHPERSVVGTAVPMLLVAGIGVLSNVTMAQKGEILRNKAEQAEERRLCGEILVGGILSRREQAQPRSSGMHSVSHWQHGVYEEGEEIKFEGDWKFPYGTNHLSSVEVMAWGDVLPDGFSRDKVATLGRRVSFAREQASFTYGLTPSNSYVFIWTGTRDGRINGVPFEGRIELFRNGDVAVTTNGVTTLTPRELPFEHDGYGQDGEWVAANFTNATEIAAAGGYAAWVDGQVGEGLTNGLYKLTVSLAEDPPEATLLTVGVETVAVTNAGEYVFLLEKGIEYPLSVFPRDATNFVYSVADDVSRTTPPLRMSRGPVNSPRYSVSLHSHVQQSEAELVVPSIDRDGYVVYVPQLCIMPEVEPDPVFPVMLGAAVFDIPFGREASYAWRGEGISETGPYFLWNGDDDVDCISVEATYGSVTVCGAVCIERHVLESDISISGGGLIVIEDSYTNAPGEVVEASSTSVALGVTWSLAESGTLRLESSCAGAVKVMEDAGGDVRIPVCLPREWQLDADDEDSADFLVSVTNMAAIGDLGTFTLTFTPADGGAVLTRSVDLRSVKVRVEALADWPSNKVRHVFGPKEVFAITQTPQSPMLSYSAEEGSQAYVTGNDCIAPDRGGRFCIQYSGGSCSGNLSFACIEPTGVRGGNPRTWTESDWASFKICPLETGEAGVAAHIDTWLEPLYVSFSHIRVFEGFALPGNRTGWYQDTSMFSDEQLAHGVVAGASHDPAVSYCTIMEEGNRFSEGDCIASFMYTTNRYMNGSYQLEIPVKWYAVNGMVTNCLPDNVQTVWVYSNGTMRINKNGITWERQLNGLEHQVEE